MKIKVNNTPSAQQIKPSICNSKKDNACPSIALLLLALHVKMIVRGIKSTLIKKRKKREVLRVQLFLAFPKSISPAFFSTKSDYSNLAKGQFRTSQNQIDKKRALKPDLNQLFRFQANFFFPFEKINRLIYVKLELKWNWARPALWQGLTTALTKVQKRLRQKIKQINSK